MVDVGEKGVTARLARAGAWIRCHESTAKAIFNLEVAKGNVLEVARLAGIMAAKKTPDLIPLCHPINIQSITVSFEQVDSTLIKVESMVKANDRTGVEMEALTAASVAALTVYDMCKSLERSMCIERIELIEKAGGKSGHYLADETSQDAN